MIKHFISLEWKSALRSRSIGSTIFGKILLGFIAVYFIVVFLFLGVGAFFLIKESLKSDPLVVVSKYLFYYFLIDLKVRYFMQKIPAMSIKPLLVLNIKRNHIINYVLGKTTISFFNIVHAFFFIPFSITLLFNGYDPIGVLCWNLAIISIIYILNFTNLLINNKDSLFYTIVGLVALFAGLQYFKIFDITVYLQPIFYGFYQHYYLFLIPLAILFFIYKYTFNFYKKDITIDSKLYEKVSVGVNDNLTWLEKFGTLGTFLKNDIRLIRRNKRAKTAVYMSIFFLFYGLFFFTNDMYSKGGFVAFASIFVTGGFLINFGQFVPSWDSSYYQFMMSQNIKYREYLNSKWLLMVIATIISTILASFYLYFGVKIYLYIVAACFYNIGCNTILILLTGAYNRTAINLESGKGALGDKKSFNAKTLLFSLPQMLIPVLLFYIAKWSGIEYLDIALIGGLGIVSIFLKNFIFDWLERIYKKEKYKTIIAYKEKN